MKMNSQFYRNTAIVAAMTIAATAAPLSAWANPTAPSTAEMSQASPSDSALLLAAAAGECRRSNIDNLGIYSGRANTTGTRVGIVRRDGVVRLSESGSGGWIGVDYPQTGFVQAQYLYNTTCPPNLIAAIDPADPLCRQVSRPPEGLAIRRSPSTSSAQIDGVGVGERVLVTNNPPTTSKDAAGRTWVQISRPSAGWVSNGFSNPTNLSNCSTQNPPPPPPPSRCRRVINPPEGLIIRREANTGSAIVGQLSLYQRMTLTTAPPTTSKDSAGRTWVQIEAPAQGWVSNGLTSGQSNIGTCP